VERRDCPMTATAATPGTVPAPRRAGARPDSSSTGAVRSEALTQADEIMIDIRLIQEIEEAAGMDCVPPPTVIAPLAARAAALRAAWANPRLGYRDDGLQDEMHAAVSQYGTILEVEEIHAVQQLRGWHRARRGSVPVKARWLAEVQRLLDSLAAGEDAGCSETLREFGVDRVAPQPTDALAAREGRSPGYVRAAVLKSLAASRDCCGECRWCWFRRLRDDCATALGGAGVA